MLDKIPFNHHKLKYFSLARIYRVVHFLPLIASLSGSVEAGVGVAVWGLQNGNLLSLILNWWELDEGLGCWP
tara:strand:+ start:133 stop:348 length:216 start_codon:yes stop_codon:yes gene_type:complete